MPSPFASLPRGLDLRVEYLRRSTFVDPGGATFPLRGVTGTVTSFLRLDQSRLVGSEQNGSVVLYDDGERTVDPNRRSAHFAYDPPSGSAWAVSKGYLHTSPVGPTTTGRRFEVGDRTPVGVVDDGSVVLTEADGRSGDVRLIDPDTGRATVVPGLGSAQAAATPGSLVAGQAVDTRQGLGQQVVVEQDGRVLWHSAAWRALSFSPDGRYLAAANNASGGDDGAIGILDSRTGEVVSQLPLLENGLSTVSSPTRGVVWESSRAILMPAYSGRAGGWAVLRVPVKGRVDRATNVVDGSGERSPWVLATQH